MQGGPGGGEHCAVSDDGDLRGGLRSDGECGRAARGGSTVSSAGVAVAILWRIAEPLDARDDVQPLYCGALGPRAGGGVETRGGASQSDSEGAAVRGAGSVWRLDR